MKCFVDNGCGKRIEYNREVQPYNCCLVSIELLKQHKAGYVRRDNAWQEFLDVDVPHKNGLINFRGHWRSKHPTELVYGMYVPAWCNRIVQSDATFLEKRHALIRCSKEQDTLDILLSLLHANINKLVPNLQPGSFEERVVNKYAALGEADGHAVRFILTP